MTLWDSGEFLAAAHSLGIPHPPATPLFIFGAHAWASLLSFLPFAYAVNLASAVSTATAAGCFAWLVARWTGRAAAGIVGALIGGAMAAVWQSATETEVYGHALLAVAALMIAAELAGSRSSGRHRALVAFCFGLAVPLHLSVLVAGPAIVLLAASDADGGISVRDAIVLSGAWMLAVGMGTVSRIPIIAGALLLVLSVVVQRSTSSGRGRFEGIAAIALTLLGASFVLAMLVRARLGPTLNEGDPSNWQAMLDVIARRQYDVPPLWPRRAPLWLQVGNVIQYADWQVALGLSDAVGPALARTPVTIAFVLLAIVGSLWHRARDRRSWNALALLLLCATGGVVVVLNLRAGPSYGWGILPDGALREARERDYFFALAFFLTGVWSGCGVVSLIDRLRGVWRPLVWLGAAAPIALNWVAVDRRRLPDSVLATEIATSLLRDLPPHAVLVLAGDNDTFPIWFAQQVQGLRPDVTPITIPLLGAGWYREQLMRRDALLDSTRAIRWAGLSETLAGIGREGRARGRPVLAAVSVQPDDRSSIEPGAGWRLSGMWYAATESPGVSVDSSGSARGARWWRDRREALGLDPRLEREARDPAGRYIQRLLSCPALAIEAPDARSVRDTRLLESICNFR